MGLWSDCGDFFRECRRDFHHTGAVLPSGGILAGELARCVGGERPPLRILEVGPGTGSVTRAIARRMRPEDQLEAVEINTRFAALLRTQLETDPVLSLRRGQISIVNSPIQDLPGQGVYDLIISGLPLNNFSPEDVRSICAAFRRLLRPGGTLSYFEYAFLHTMKIPFLSKRNRFRFRRSRCRLQHHLVRHQTDSQRIWLNVPPAIVRRLQFAEV